MIHKKRFFYPTLLAALLCGTAAAVLHAQDTAGNQPPPPHAPPPSPLFDALDTNHDGTISADEIANASAALKTLLKNGAVEIKRADVEPPHPPAGHDRRGRDDQDRDQSGPRPPAMRPHGPPADDRDDDNAAPPRPRMDDDRGDRPHHRPPPPRWREDDADMDAPHHRRPEPAGRGERPPRREEADDRAMDGGGRPHPRRDEDADRPSHRQPPRTPLFDALDTNHDGVISADEITNAPDALKKLDKTGSGQIKREDLRAMQPPRDND